MLSRIFPRFAFLAVAFFSLVTSRTADAAGRPMLWQIEGEKPSYLMGTIHVPDLNVAKIDPVVGAALEKSDEFYGELPLDFATQMSTVQLSLMQDGKTLRDVLPAELVKEIEAELNRIVPGLPLAPPLDRMQIWAIAMTLSLLEPQLKNPGAQPIDAVLYQKAESLSKKTGGLETVQEQVGVFSGFSQEEQITMLRETLAELKRGREEGKSLLAQMTEIYLSGDLEKLNETMNAWMKQGDQKLAEKFEKALLTDRNVTMAKRMDEKMKAQPDKSFFFAIGAGHLAGETGVIKLLEKAGYKLKQVPAAQ